VRRPSPTSSASHDECISVGVSSCNATASWCRQIVTESCLCAIDAECAAAKEPNLLISCAWKVWNHWKQPQGEHCACNRAKVAKVAKVAMTSVLRSSTSSLEVMSAESFNARLLNRAYLTGRCCCEFRWKPGSSRPKACILQLACRLPDSTTSIVLLVRPPLPKARPAMTFCLVHVYAHVYVYVCVSNLRKLCAGHAEAEYEACQGVTLSKCLRQLSLLKAFCGRANAPQPI
jgi:hypothetical protein